MHIVVGGAGYGINRLLSLVFNNHHQIQSRNYPDDLTTQAAGQKTGMLVHQGDSPVIAVAVSLIYIGLLIPGRTLHPGFRNNRLPLPMTFIKK